MWNVKQKDNGMDQNILHYCHDDYVTTNEQTQIKKAFSRDFACCIILKDLPKPITVKLPNSGHLV